MGVYRTMVPLITTLVSLQNLLYWEEYMASKPCPIYGWVDKDFVDCVKCNGCLESGK